MLPSDVNGMCRIKINVMCSVQQRHFFYASVIKCILKLFKCYICNFIQITECCYASINVKTERGDLGHTITCMWDI